MKKYMIAFMIIFLASISLIAADGSTTKVDVLAKTTTSWNGVSLPKYSRGKPEITILRIEIPPHTELAWHEHPVINAGFMVSGELTVVTDKSDTLLLKAGDPIVEVVNTWHFGMNEGDDPVDIIVFYAGVKGKDITILEDE